MRHDRGEGVKNVKNSLLIAAGLAFAAALIMGGCIAVPVGDPGYASPGQYGPPGPYGPPSQYGPPGPVVVVPIPFPKIWIGPGHYRGRYYRDHPDYPPHYRER
jgi:hypothetical protein